MATKTVLDVAVYVGKDAEVFHDVQLNEVTINDDGMTSIKEGSTITMFINPVPSKIVFREYEIDDPDEEDEADEG